VLHVAVLVGCVLLGGVIHVIVHSVRLILLTGVPFLVIIGSVLGNVPMIIVVKVCAVCLAHADLIRSLIYYRCYVCDVHDVAHVVR